MTIRSTFMLLALIVFPAANATQFFALNHQKDGKSYNNQISELDKSSGQTLASINLNKSYKSPAEKLVLPSNQYMFIYANKDKNTATLQIINKSDLNTVKSLEIDQLNSRFVPAVGLVSFKYLTDDQKHLIIHTGYKKNQFLTVIDVHTGVISNKIPISKYKNSIEISSDQKYMLVNNTSRDELTVINLNNFKVVLTSQLGKFRRYGIIHNDYLYLTKFKGKHPKQKHWIQALNLMDSEKSNFTQESLSQPIFAVTPKSNQLLSLTTTERGKVAVLSNLIGNQINELGSYAMKIQPEEMFVNEDFMQVLIKGKGSISSINFSDLSQFVTTKLPFDAIQYGYNDSGNFLYLKEGTGSEVAVIDVKTGELIDRSGTGRQGVKFGQFMASVALAGVGMNYGYGIYFTRYSNTGFTLNNEQDKLYVINSKTNDVTHFNASDLSGRKAIATGGSTFLVHQGNAPMAPLWVFSGKRINQINDQDFTLEKEIEFEKIIGFDMEADYFIIKTEQDIQTYDMKSGDITNQWPMSTVQEVWTE